MIWVHQPAIQIEKKTKRAGREEAIGAVLAKGRGEEGLL
jgi:hypothetical protein